MSAAGVRRVTLVVGTTAGGTGAHVRMLAAGLAARGVAVLVAGPRQANAALGLDQIPGARFAVVEFGDRPRPGDATAVLELRRLLTGPAVKPDTVPPHIVHAHGMRAGALAAIALAGTGARKPGLVVTTHNAPPPGGAARLVYLALERIVGKRADLVLAVSSDLERRMRKAGARSVTRAVVPPPGRPAPESEHGTTRLRHDGRPLILAVGRLAPQKGFATLLEAAAAWQHRTPKPRLLMVGDGPLKASLEARAAQLQVDAEFPGHRDDVPQLLKEASVFVMPSLWEGQPLALQEALREGVPVVASAAGGIPDLTGDDAALLVRPGSQRELGQAVLSVLDNHDLSGRLRAAARRRSATLPAPGDAVTAVLAAYESARQ